MTELQEFESHIGDTFELRQHIDGTEFGVGLVLTSVERYVLKEGDARLTDTTGRFRKEPFSLTFSGAHKPYLPQGTYHVIGPDDMGEVELFITCLGPSADGTLYHYQSVFN